MDQASFGKHKCCSGRQSGVFIGIWLGSKRKCRHNGKYSAWAGFYRYMEMALRGLCLHGFRGTCPVLDADIWVARVCARIILFSDNSGVQPNSKLAFHKRRCRIVERSCKPVPESMDGRRASILEMRVSAVWQWFGGVFVLVRRSKFSTLCRRLN